VDRFNRQLHPDERQWAKDNAKAFAKFYSDQIGQTITEDQAQTMLLANGYRLVDAAASKGPGGNALAAAYINQNGGNLFTATPAEYNSPFLYSNKDGSLTPEQRALPGAVANPKLGLAIAGALAAPAVLPVLAAIPGAPIFGIDGALGSGAWASSTGTGVISAGINAGSQYYQNGTVNPIDVAIAAISGGVGASGKLGWNVFVNGVGGATGTVINNAVYGRNDSIIGSGITSGALSAVGYTTGKAAESWINSSLRPTINNANGWATSGIWSGSGWNLIQPNAMGVIGGSIGGGITQEAVTPLVPTPSIGGNKK
jgi:filamentous hemagglutinin